MKYAAPIIIFLLTATPVFALSLVVQYEGQAEYDNLKQYVKNYQLKGNPDTMTDAEKVKEFKDSIESKINYTKAGTQISIADGKISFVVPNEFSFISKGQALYLYEFTQDKVPDQEERSSLQGILVTNGKFFDDSSAEIYLDYFDDGHISDEDSSQINGDEMIAQLEKQRIENNNNKGDNETKLENTVWLIRPRYDGSKHLFEFSDYFDEVRNKVTVGTTINSDIIFLGRTGKLTAIIVATKENASAIVPVVEKIKEIIQYTKGNKYEDYNYITDHKSDLTIAGVAAGAIGVNVLAKLGFWALLLKFSKTIIIAIVVFFKKIKNFILQIFRKKKQTPDIIESGEGKISE